MPPKRHWLKWMNRLIPCQSERAIGSEPGHSLVRSPFVKFSTKLEAIRANYSAPIACLAPEILSEIFLHCVPTSYEGLNSDLSWINVTRVSHHWREVALACPQLWTSIIFSRPRWVPIMLSRAKMAPLTIRVDLNRNGSNLLQPVLDNRFSSIRVLELRASRSVLEALFESIVTEMPLLESLTIRNIDSDNLETGGLWISENTTMQKKDVETIKIPSPSRKLRYLELYSCAFPWDSPRYNNLTHLKLYWIHPAQRPNMCGLLSILVASPGLQDLTLVEATPAAEDCFVVDLPHLSAITLHDPVVDCASLLEHLSFPETTIMSIICPSLSPQPWTFESEVCRRLIPAIADHYSSKPIYDSVRIKHIRTQGAEIVLNHSRGFKLLNLHLNSSLWLHTFAVKATRAMFRSFPIAHVLGLELEGSYRSTLCKADLEEWVVLWRELNRFRRLRILRLNQMTPPMVLEVLLQRAMFCIGVCLQPSTEHIGVDGMSRQLLPNLERIVLRNLDCNVNLAASGPSLIDSLRSFLWARRQGKTPILNLEIQQCHNIYSQDLAHLRYLADVSWDGQGKNTAEKDEGGDYISSFSMHVFTQMTDLILPQIEGRFDY